MKNRPPFYVSPRCRSGAAGLRLAFLSAFYAFFAVTSSLTSPAQDFADSLEQSGWFVRADAAARFNLKANIKAIPPPSGPGIYDDGTVFPDISGSASGLTWNWSYQSDNQIRYDTQNQPQAIVLQRLDNVPNIGSRDVSLPSPVFEGELIGGYHFDYFKIGKRRARLSFEVGYGYFSLSQDLDFQASGTVTHTTHFFGLGGVVPPVAPYAGTFNGPGPLLDLNPDAANSSTNIFLSTTAFQGSLDVNFHNFRVGPSFGIDLASWLNVQLGAGYASLYTQADLKYLESSAYTPTPSTVILSSSKWRPGIYSELLLNFQIFKNLQAFLGGDFQYNNDLTFGDARHEVTIELGSTYAAKGGLSFSF